MIQTSYDIIKSHGGVPIAIGLKSGSIPCEKAEFSILISLTENLNNLL
jgi:hypothetical protein